MVTRHDLRLTGLAELADQAFPVVVRSTAQEFVPAFLRELGSDAGRAALRFAVVGPGEDGVREYLQPVQRAWQLAAVEAWCAQPGRPRLDPRKIDSAGLVVRRVARDPKTGQPALRDASRVLQAWSVADGHVLGWVDLGADAESRDPDPARRRARRVGHPEIDRRLASAVGVAPAESSSPLFVAPPEVGERTRRTVLFGVVPVASAEVAEGPADAAPGAPAGDEEELVATLLPLVLPQGNAPEAITGSLLRRSHAEAKLVEGEEQPSAISSLLTLLSRLAVDLDVFAQPKTEATLHRFLAGHMLPYGDERVPAAEVLRDLSDLLIRDLGSVPERGRGARPHLNADRKAVRLPSEWPVLDSSGRKVLSDALRDAIRARRASIRPRELRFAGPNERFVLRAFMRVRRDDGCPPELVWSAYSHEFRIAPWYAASPVPPPIVPLPEPTPAALAAARPNVAFQFPPGMLDRLQRIRLKGLVERKLPKEPGIDLGYIVTLNVLIVTIVAFIVLLVIAAILDMIFRWMPYLIVRIPIPKPR